MRPILLALVVLLAGLAVFWFTREADDTTSAPGDDPLSGVEGEAEPAAAREPAWMRTAEASGAKVLEDVPAGLWEDIPDGEPSVLEDIEVLEIRIKIPNSKEKLNGDLVLRSLGRALGANRPFHFADAASLAKFRSEEFEGLPAGEATVGELLALVPRAGLRFFQRDGRFYIMPPPDRR